MLKLRFLQLLSLQILHHPFSLTEYNIVVGFVVEHIVGTKNLVGLIQVAPVARVGSHPSELNGHYRPTVQSPVLGYVEWQHHELDEQPCPTLCLFPFLHMRGEKMSHLALRWQTETGRVAREQNKM